MDTFLKLSSSSILFFTIVKLFPNFFLSSDPLKFYINFVVIEVPLGTIGYHGLFKVCDYVIIIHIVRSLHSSLYIILCYTSLLTIISYISNSTEVQEREKERKREGRRERSVKIKVIKIVKSGFSKLILLKFSFHY